MTKDKTIHLLIIHDSEEEAEKILSILRNSQIPVRPTRCTNDEVLKETLDKKRIDLILVDNQQKDLPSREATQIVKKTGKDIPVVTLIESFSDDAVFDSIELGSDTLCCPNVSEHFCKVIKRTHNALLTRRKLRVLEAELNEAEKRTSLLLESSKEAIAYIHDGFHVYVNPAYIELFESEDADEMTVTPFLDLVNKSEVQKAKTLLKDISADRVPTEEVDMVLKTLNGNEVKAVITLSKATYDGEPCVQFLVQPPKGNAEAEKELEMIRNKDLMTGYYNRSYFINHLNEHINSIKSGKNILHSIMYVHVDDAVRISKELGKGKYDLLIADIAKFIQEDLGSSLTYTRYEESSFMIQVPKNIEDTTKIAEHLLTKTSQHLFNAGDKTLNCSVSVSVTQVIEQTKNTDDVLLILSNEMDNIKDEGGNKVSVFDPAEEEKKALQANQELIETIEKGLKENHFFLNYQNIANLHGDELELYEVLVRLKKGDDVIMPAKFIEVAKKYGLIHDIDKKLVSNAIDAIKFKDNKVGLFIKLSTDSLCDSAFPIWLAEKIKERGVLAERLIFEVTESELITHSKSIKPVMKALKDLNCQITIEKFGLGLNSFTLVKQFPVDFIKLDPSFTKNIGDQENNQKAKAIIDKCHALNKMVIFERVEDASTMSSLWTLSANYVQGNFIGEVSQSMNHE